MKKTLLLFLLFLLTAPTAFATSQEIYDGLDAAGLEQELPAEASDFLKEGLAGSADVEEALGGILEGAFQEGGSIFRQGLGTLAIVFAAVVLCAVCQNMLQGKHQAAVLAVGVLAVTAASLYHMGSLLTLTQTTLENLDVFSKALLPTLTAASGAAGMPATATARYLATILFSNLLLSAIRLVLLPCTVAMVAVAAVDAALPESSLGGVTKFLRWVVKTVLTLLLFGFTAYLTVTGILSRSTDAMAVKGVKLAVSTAIPVVGSVLSDAADTVLSAAGIVRNVLGVAGLLAVLVLCLTPFLKLGVGVLLYRLTSALSAPFADKRLCSLLDTIGDALNLMLAQLGSGALLLFLSITSAVLAVGGGT